MPDEVQKYYNELTAEDKSILNEVRKKFGFTDEEEALEAIKQV